MMVFLLAVTLALRSWKNLGSFKRSDMLMIVLSGLFGATSWLMSFKALSLAQGEVFRVGAIDKLSVPIAAVLALVLLGERPTDENWIGVAMIVAGAILAAAK